MAFKEVLSLDAENVISLGGINKKTGKKNPTSAEGFYLGNRTVASKRGDSKLHFFQTDEGNLGVWGKTDLDRKLGTITPGNMVRVSYVGMKSTPNGDMYSFKVEQDVDQTIDVSNITTASTTADESEGYDDGDDDGYGVGDSGDDFDTPPPARISAADRQAKIDNLLKGKKG